MDSRTIFLEHIGSIQFEVGSVKGKWGVADNLQLPNWPYVVLWVAAGIDGSKKYFIRLELSNYPISAPEGILWDIEHDQQLSYPNYPKGDIEITNVFIHNTHIYAPCDRRNSHPEWVNHSTYGEFFWKSGHTVVSYLRFIHMILKSAM